jgi:hypothetical protein
MAWSTPATYTAGQILTAAQMNLISANLNAGGPCFLRVRRAAAQAIATSTLGAVNFDTEDVDTASIFTASSNRIIVATAGLYQLSATVSFATNGTGARSVAIFASSTVSGATDAATVTGGTRITGAISPPSTTTQTVLSCSTLYSVTAAQAFSVSAYQESGGNLNIAATEQVSFSIAYVGAL